MPSYKQQLINRVTGGSTGGSYYSDDIAKYQQALLDAGIEPPVPDAEKKGLWKKFVNVISAPLNAVAGHNRYLAQEAKKDAALGRLPIGTALKTLTGLNAIDRIKAMRQGVKDDTTHSQVIEEHLKGTPLEPYQQSKVGKIGTAAAGFGLDIAFDPLTYVTAGTGKGLKVGGKTLSRKGTKLAGQELTKMSKEIAEEIAKKGVTKVDDAKILKDLVRGAQTGRASVTSRLAPLTAKYAREGGLKFGGTQILGKESLFNYPFGVGKKLEELAPIARKGFEKNLRPITDPFGKLLWRDHRSSGADPTKWTKSVKMKQKYLDEGSRLTEKNIEKAMKVFLKRDAKGFKSLGAGAREAITNVTDINRKNLLNWRKATSQLDDLTKKYSKLEKVLSGTKQVQLEDLINPTTKLKQAATQARQLDDLAIELANKSDEVAKLTKLKNTDALLSLPKESQRYAREIDNIYAKLAKIDIKRGLYKEAMEHYFPHQWKDPIKARKILRTYEAFPSTKIKYGKHRVIPTLDEAVKLGLEPERDAARLLVKRIEASTRAWANQDYINAIASEFGKTPKEVAKITAGAMESLEDMPKLSKFILKDRKVVSASKYADYVKLPTTLNQGEFLIPSYIADDIVNMGKRAIDDETINTMLRGFDKAQNYWKGSVTSLFPSFHGRNALSNVAQNFLDVGVSAMDPRLHKASLELVDPFGKNIAGSFTDDLGQVWDYDELRSIMKDRKVFGGYWGGQEIGEDLVTKLDDMTNKLDKYKDIKNFNPISSRNLLFRGGRKVGSTIEDQGRVLNFLANLKRGVSPDDAARSVKQFLFDYGNLSTFERNIMKRIVPFYTWTRKNIELQARMLAKAPGKFAGIGKVASAAEYLTGDQTEAMKYLPDWIKDSWAIPLGKNKVGLPQFLYSSGFLPVESAINTFKKPFAALGTISPYLKWPFELASGKTFWNDKEIDEQTTAPSYLKYLPEGIKKKINFTETERTSRTGETYIKYQANPIMLYFMNSLPTSRGTRFIEDIVNPKTTLPLQVLKHTTGAKPHSYDIEQEQIYRDREYMEELMDELEKTGVMRRYEMMYVPSSGGNTAYDKMINKSMNKINRLN